MGNTTDGFTHRGHSAVEEGVPTRDEAHKVTTHIIIAVSSQTHQRWLEVWNDYDGTDDDERMTNMINALQSHC